MSKTPDMLITSSFACDLTAIEADQRDQHGITAKQLFTLVQEVSELSDGYALRLPNDSDTVLLAARFIAHDRQCCPFFNFTLELQAENGPFWLKLTGQEGVKQSLQAELGHRLNKTVAQAAGLR